MNEVIRNLLTRRSVRKFTDKKIPREELDILLKVALAAPSGPITSLCVPVFSALYVIFSFLGTSFNYLDRFGIYFLPFCALLFVDFGKRLQEQSVLLARVYRVGLHVCFVAYFVLFATNLPHYVYSFMW